MRLLRFASTSICLIVIASFIVFAINETKSASGRQRDQLEPAATQAATAGPVVQAPAPAQPTHKSAVHRTLDDAAAELTSPFSGLVTETSSEWAERGLKLLAALIVYGFGLGYLARALRVRV